MNRPHFPKTSPKHKRLGHWSFPPTFPLPTSTRPATVAPAGSGKETYAWQAHPSSRVGVIRLPHAPTRHAPLAPRAHRPKTRASQPPPPSCPRKTPQPHHSLSQKRPHPLTIPRLPRRGHNVRSSQFNRGDQERSQQCDKPSPPLATSKSPIARLHEVQEESRNIPTNDHHIRYIFIYL